MRLKKKGARTFKGSRWGSEEQKPPGDIYRKERGLDRGSKGAKMKIIDREEVRQGNVQEEWKRGRGGGRGTTGRGGRGSALSKTKGYETAPPNRAEEELVRGG